jgi:dihydrofolate synthase/folylpolyglutamate synthase
MTVGMAFDYFAKQKVDIAVIEVGLGGRLDSTNIITPEVSVITNIGFDHTQFLGDTLEQIAFEKAGIIKHNIPVVIGETQKETKPVFERISKEKKAAIYFADSSEDKLYESDLKGAYQKHNIKTVIATISELKRKGYKISHTNVVNGLKRVIKNTGLQGRWQVLQLQPKVIVDTAHNKEGLTYTMHQIKTEPHDQLHLVLGFVNDKKLDTIIDLFPTEAQYYLCKPNVQRGLEVDALKDYFVSKNYNVETYNSVAEAFEKAKIKASTNDLIYVGGSTFVVAEII